MPSLTVYDEIRGYLEANWTATPLVFENEAYDPTVGQPFVEIEFQGTYFSQESIGAEAASDNRFDEEGDCFFHMMVPANSGTRVARSHLSNLAGMFRGHTLASGAIEFLSAKVGFGESPDTSSQNRGSWYRLTMILSWRHTDAS